MAVFWKTVVIGDNERGLEFRDKRFERVLTPGVYRIARGFAQRDVRIYDLGAVEYANKDVDTLIERLGTRVEEHFVLADVGVDEVGLLTHNGKLVDVLAPGQRKLYWRRANGIAVERVALGDNLEVPGAVAKRLRQLGTLAKFALGVEVPAESVALVFVDGKLVRTLGPGSYAFWNFGKNVAADIFELRVQTAEVAGQELLTRDKVTLRINLAASFRIVDAVQMRGRVAKFGEYFYRELQFGLRKAVATKTLDELLGDKASLDDDIATYVRERVADFGVDVLGVGVKDVILPGEMREILNSVVQAEKAAQANVIRRREEANATRSALNTARLIEESPALMRLKELETLEKVTEKIDKLTVFGGLDGVLNQLVKLKVGT